MPDPQGDAIVTALFFGILPGIAAACIVVAVIEAVKWWRFERRR